MEGKGMKVFGVIMSLLLVFSFAATFSLSNTSVVSAGTQKWTQVSIPGTDDMQIAPGTAVGDIAVSPDGETLFAALYVGNASELDATFGLSTGNWYVFKSIDEGYTWKKTGFTDDTWDIVAIEVSPDWVNDGIVVVATDKNVYFSTDRGSVFKTTSADTITTANSNMINSLDVTLDDNGNVAYAIGTSGVDGEVYLASGSGFSGWTEQYVEDPGGTGDPLAGAFTFTANGGVLDVAFSPNYAQDGVVMAIVRGQAPLDFEGTWLRAESDTSTNNWGSYISDASFRDSKDVANIVAQNASMAFADDYNSQPAVFVGLTAYETPDDNTTEPRGDAFRVDLVSGALGASAVTDLNVRPDERTNIFSIAVSGDSGSAFILVGNREMSQSGVTSNWQGGAAYSSNGGESWLPSLKPPACTDPDNPGVYALAHSSSTIVMAPDFDESGIAYCGNGYDAPFYSLNNMFNGFHVSTTQGTTWNGRGLLNYTIDEISDILPSPGYDTDSTLFMVTRTNTYFFPYDSDFGLLWKTVDGGKQWELILSMNLATPYPGLIINSVEVPAQYPNDETVYVYGPEGPIGANSGFMRSVDTGGLWATSVKGPYENNVPQLLDAWKVIDKDTIIAANSSDLWFTTDAGAHWTKSGGAESTNDVGANENVVDLQLWNDQTVLVGTDDGNVYMCQDWEMDFSYSQVDSSVGVAGDEVRVAFDANYDDNGTIYAGVDGSGGGGATTQGIWRIDANTGDEWENIWDGDDILSIACDGNGILWAIDGAGNSQREVNPTHPIDELGFEDVDDGTPSALTKDLETAPTQTYVFAIGGAGNLELWAYIDTLIKPTLMSPSDGTTAAGTIIEGTATARVSLMWEEMPKSNDYQWEIAYDPEFGSLADFGNLSGTQVAVNLFLGEKYYWRVRVSENQPVYSQWSEVWDFTTPLGPASSKPVCLSPTKGAEDVILKPTLQWSSSVEATSWELMVAKNCDFSDAVVNLQGSTALPADVTAYQITQDLQEGTNYCWKVRGVNDDTSTVSPWSDTGTFTTLTVVVEEEEGTPVWVWVVIALSAVLLVGVVVLIIRTRRPV